jgi:hypothetical protein
VFCTPGASEALLRPLLTTLTAIWSLGEEQVVWGIIVVLPVTTLYDQHLPPT